MLQRIREFLTLGSLATVASVVGIGSGIYNMTRGGSSPGGGGPAGASTYVPQGQGQADDLWRQLMTRMGSSVTGGADMLGPYLMQAFQQMQQRNAGQQPRLDYFSGRLEEEANNSFRSGGALRNAGDMAFSAGRDERGAEYARNLQRTQEGSREATSMRGIGMSPQAAGIENQAVGNFNIDWSSQQLARMLAGLHGMTGAYDAGGRQSQLGNAQLAGSADMFTHSSMLPWQAANLWSQGMNQGIYQPMSGLQSNLGSYMGLGQAGSAANFGQGQTNLNNLTTGLNQFGQSPGGNWLQNFFNPPNAGTNNNPGPGGDPGSGNYGAGP